MSDLTDFKRLVHEPAMENWRRDAERLRRAGSAVVEAAKHLEQPIDLNYVAIPKDLWEDITHAIAGVERRV